MSPVNPTPHGAAYSEEPTKRSDDSGKSARIVTYTIAAMAGLFLTAAIGGPFVLAYIVLLIWLIQRAERLPAATDD
jgi:fatty acid desaturase